jgi:hypothetical protein
VDCPSQVVLQPEPQVPVQVVLASQWETQPEAQSTLQLFMCWQSSVTSEGALEPPPSTLPPSTSRGRPPRLQLPPLVHLQLVPVQVQSPVQAMATARSVQPTHRRHRRTKRMLSLRAAAPLDT